MDKQNISLSHRYKASPGKLFSLIENGVLFKLTGAERDNDLIIPFSSSTEHIENVSKKLRLFVYKLTYFVVFKPFAFIKDNYYICRFQ